MDFSLWAWGKRRQNLDRIQPSRILSVFTLMYRKWRMITKFVNSFLGVIACLGRSRSPISQFWPNCHFLMRSKLFLWCFKPQLTRALRALRPCVFPALQRFLVVSYLSPNFHVMPCCICPTTSKSSHYFETVLPSSRHSHSEVLWLHPWAWWGSSGHLCPLWASSPSLPPSTTKTSVLLTHWCSSKMWDRLCTPWQFIPTDH